MLTHRAIFHYLMDKLLNKATNYQDNMAIIIIFGNVFFCIWYDIYIYMEKNTNK